MEINVSIKTGEGGKIFGSVSTKEIAQAAQEQLGVELDKKKMQLPSPIKTLGNHHGSDSSAPEGNCRAESECKRSARLCDYQTCDASQPGGGAVGSSVP